MGPYSSSRSGAPKGESRRPPRLRGAGRSDPEVLRSFGLVNWSNQALITGHTRYTRLIAKHSASPGDPRIRAG